MIKNKFNLNKFIIGTFFATQMIFSGLILAFPLSPALAQSDAATPAQFTPQVSIPGSNYQAGEPIAAGNYDDKTGIMTSDLLAKYIISFYNYGIAIAGVLATIMLMAAGVIWLTSGGDSGKISQAKDLISGSIIGVVILTCAWIILNTINPNLTKLTNLETSVIKPDIIGCCDVGGIGFMTTSKGCKGGTIKPNTFVSAAGKCEEKICCVYNGDTCFDSTKSTCSSLDNATDFKAQAGSCNQVAACKNNVLNCSGKKEGDAAYGINGIIPKAFTSFRCYGGIVMVGAGNENEGCGTKGDAGSGICIKESETCTDTNQIGGRSCKSGLKCCLDGAVGSW